MNEATRLQAPQENGAVLAIPPLDQGAALLEENATRLTGGGVSPHRSFSLPLSDLRQAARTVLLDEAVGYMQEAGEPIPPINGDRLILAGHQPELFHPGVWLKNFALAGLARRNGATAVNLIVDSDTMKSAGIRVPSPADADDPFPHGHTVLFDYWQPDVPYELCRVRDENLFHSFGARVENLMRRWNGSSLITHYWPLVQQQASHTPFLGERIVRARRVIERDWRCDNLEVPLSRLCRTAPFLRFVAHLLASAPSLHAIYNECVRRYRKRNGIRSRNHPVPDLANDGDWNEVPLWSWHSGDRKRSRLFVRAGAGGIELRSGKVVWPSLPADPEAAALVLRELVGQGYDLRTRALLTAMFARVLLSDLFIHGIGGAKYDEVTDDIIRCFFGFEPPRFQVLSGTLRLPLPTFAVSSADRQRLAHELRDLLWNPQRHLERAWQSADLNRLAQEKYGWIAGCAGRNRSPRDCHVALKHLNRQMAPFFDGDRRRLKDEIRRIDQELKASKVLQRRDYAFCLFPEEMLRAFYTQVVE
jgi:hypothetical protein